MILDTNMDDADYLCQTFSESLEDGTEVDLIPNGHDIPVTEANKQEFIRLLIEYKYKVSIAPFVDAMSNGMKEVLSSSIVSQIGHLFTPDSFRIILCGQPVIDVEEMIKFTFFCASCVDPPLYPLFQGISECFIPMIGIILQPNTSSRFSEA